ncbi:MAG: hypothetical protein ACK4N5_09365, partial [Myxococcales bacterium]
ALLCGTALATVATPSQAAGLGSATPRAGELDVVLRHDGTNNALDPDTSSLVHLTRIDGVWRPPVNIGGYVHKDSEIGLTSRATNTLDLVARWTDGTIRRRAWTLNGGWGNWTTISTGSTGVTAGPSITAYGGGKLAVAWRNTAGTMSITTSSNAGSTWTAPGTITKIPVKVNSAPTLSASGTTGLLAVFQHSSFDLVARSTFAGTTGTPETDASWTSPLGDPLVNTTFRNTVSQGSNRFFVGGARELVRIIPKASGTSGSFVSMGGIVAGSTTTARAGESTLPNTPTSSWSIVNTGSTTQQADVFWRTDDGCLSTRSKTDPAETAAWTAAAVVPTQKVSARCLWPSRTGTAPVMKRTDPSDNGDFAAAESAFWPSWTSGNPQADWYSSKYQSIVLHQGYNWSTSWAPRNWHPAAWAYRKSTSYSADEGLHNTSPTSSHFVRRTDNNELVAIKWGCSASGCPQPLLNVTSTAAQDFWLYGSDGVVTSGGGCHGEPNSDGILDFLACNTGQNAWSAESRGQYKGVWLDDVLPELADNTAQPAWDSRIANFTTGVPLANGEITGATGYTRKVPFTPAQWEDGLATMIERLRAGINTLKSQGKLRSYDGKIAINYKWDSYGFATTTPVPTISATSAAGRIIKAADYVEQESGWVDHGLTGGGGAAMQWSYRRKQNFIDQIHGLGTKVIDEKTVCREFAEYASPSADCARTTDNGTPIPQGATNDASHYATAQYNLASTLLNYVAGDMVGDMADYYGRGWAGYSTDVGDPTGARAPVNASYPDGAQQ